MIKLDLDAPRSEIDLENKYVDFSLIRTSLTVEKVFCDLNVILSAPTKAGECRGSCPKCGKERNRSSAVRRGKRLPIGAGDSLVRRLKT